MRLTFAAAILLVLCNGASNAQDAAREEEGGAWQAKTTAPSTAVGKQEPILPEVLVQPEQATTTPSTTASEPAPGATGAGETPPPDQESDGQQPSGPFDLPQTYPSLAQQVYGAGQVTALDSATRSPVSVFDTPNLGTIISQRDLIERQPTDMVQALQNEVGVLMQQTARGQASPFVRGLTGQQVLLLVDGVRLNNATYRAGTNQYFNLIDPGQVERIEVMRGPGSVLWGSDAIGGVINVVTRSPDRQRCDYTGAGFIERFGTADTSSYTRGNVEGWFSRGGLFGGGSYLNVNDLDTGGELGRQPFTSYQQHAADLKFQRMVGDDALLTVAVQHFRQNNLPRSDRFAPFVFGPPAGSPRPTFFDPQVRDLVYIRFEGLARSEFFDTYSSTVSYSFNREFVREERSSTRVDVGQFEDDMIGYTLALAKDLDVFGRLVYGVDFYHDEVGAWRNRLNPATGAVTPDNPQFPDGSRYDRAGAFARWEAELLPRLTGTAGVRYENDEAAGTINQVRGTPTPFDRSYHDWVATAGLVFELNPMLHLVGNYSEGYRPPNLDDLTADNPVLQNAADLPSLDVQPEHARTYEVGLKLDTPRLRGQIFQFWTRLDDNILRQAVDSQGNPVPNVIGPYGTVIPGSSNFIRANFDCYVYGTELLGEYLLHDGWSVYGNFWYTLGQDLDRDEPLSRIPPLQGTVGLRWRDPSRMRWFDVYTWMVARQDRYSAQNNIDARFPLGGTPGYATFNLRMGTTLDTRHQQRLSLNLENITDKGYRVLGSGVDGPGFNAILGYEWLH